MHQNVIERALQSAHEGATDASVALLEGAGSRGDSAAAAELAAWFLRGDVIPRDLSRARVALRQAVTIGHVDAALLEVALTANGTGGVADWQAACSLLSGAAEHDPVAGEHLALLSAMRLDPNGYPRELPKPEVLSLSPYVALFHDALSRAECLHIASVANPLLEPGVVVDPATRRAIAHPIRSSFNATIGPAQETLPIVAVNRRLASITRTKLSAGEPLQVLRYAPDQQYKLHSDALPGEVNQRCFTAISYLNDGFAGGETDFPSLALRITPKAGDILIFRNTTSAGVADPRSRHSGLPVRSGVKWVATRWIRMEQYDPWGGQR
jgi:prolyl 4-hydroxylase